MNVMEKDSAELKSEIESVVRESIRSGDVLNITVDRGRDADGDDIIVVNVIFDSKDKTLDARETLQVTRFARDRLIRMNENRFPIFTYIAKSEAGKLSAAS